MTARELRDGRHELGMSQRQLGAAFGVSRRAVADWESGTVRVPGYLTMDAAIAILRLVATSRAATP